MRRAKISGSSGIRRVILTPRNSASRAFRALEHGPWAPGLVDLVGSKLYAQQISWSTAPPSSALFLSRCIALRAGNLFSGAHSSIVYPAYTLHTARRHPWREADLSHLQIFCAPAATITLLHIRAILIRSRADRPRSLSVCPAADLRQGHV